MTNTRYSAPGGASDPTLDFAFSARVELAPPIELGQVDGWQQRFIPIAGGTVSGPRLTGTVLGAGGDWQRVGNSGLTEVEARYFLRAEDGAIIGVVNAGVRSASEAVTARLVRGDKVGADDYYFRTAPRFAVTAGPHDWLRRTILICRGIRMPDHVIINFYAVS